MAPPTLVAVILGSVMAVLAVVLAWVVFRGGPKDPGRRRGGRG